MFDKVVVKDEVLEAGVDNFGFEHVKLWALCMSSSELWGGQAESSELWAGPALICELKFELWVMLWCLHVKPSAQIKKGQMLLFIQTCVVPKNLRPTSS